MEYSNGQIIIGLIVLILLGYILYNCWYNKHHQPADVIEHFDIPSMVQNPDVTWFESPSTFGSDRYIRQAAQPMSDGRMLGPGAPQQFQAVDPMGFVDMVQPHNDCPPELKGLTRPQIDKLISEKVTNQMKLPSTEEALVELDASSNLYGKDPRDAATFLPPRQIFAVKKRRNLEGTDYIRGDLRIKPLYRGWFDNFPKPSLDLRVGALQQGTVGADMPSVLSNEDYFVDNVRFDAGLDRLDLIHGQQCANVMQAPAM